VMIDPLAEDWPVGMRAIAHGLEKALGSRDGSCAALRGSLRRLATGGSCDPSPRRGIPPLPPDNNPGTWPGGESGRLADEQRGQGPARPGVDASAMATNRRSWKSAGAAPFSNRVRRNGLSAIAGRSCNQFAQDYGSPSRSAGRSIVILCGRRRGAQGGERRARRYEI
jgi:hypothetical protein